MPTRREFFGISAAAAGVFAVPAVQARVQRAPRPLDMLFLGGTGFIGPHQIEYALARGHRVTMFNRGRNSGLYGDRVEELTGNRDSRKDDGLKSLSGRRRWDVVIDNSGYVPRHVRDSAELLRGRVGRYLYISTVAVYDFDSGSVFDESSPLARLEDPSVEEVNWSTYGPLKAECDRIVRGVYGDSSTVVRPIYIVGPGDSTDRFTYWIERVAQGGDVLGPPDRAFDWQWVDARDLCPWIVDLAERNEPGIFNAAGPASRVTREQTLWGLSALTDQPVRFHWPDRTLLKEMDISLPMIPAGGEPERFISAAAQEAGLRYRSLADTALGTRDWWRAQSEERRANPRGWLSAEQEGAAIARIAARS